MSDLKQIEKPQDPLRAVKDCAAGSVGGIAQVLAGQRIQTQPELYNGTMDCLKKTIASDGFAGLYKGTATPLVGIGVCVSIQFLTMEYMKRTFARINGAAPTAPLSLTPGQLYISGAIAGLANGVVSGPVEHIRTRLQVQTSGAGGKLQYAGPLDCIKKIYSSHGISGIYKGQIPTLIREFNAYGVYFLVYESLVKNAMERKGIARDQLSSVQVMQYGAAAGMAIWLTTYPADIVKSKIQTDGFGSAGKYKGTLDCVRQIMAKDGVKGFFRGITPCLLRAAPANAATFLGFELAMRVLG
ncbi:Mitochondrial carrier protein ymc2 [Mycoemilia scoparia]|uniref:Mitochondrial carrier protein ymc2 n=1 Tax=Mycoemilia scoparia TaxID=417184 RepID=A0A9W7ZW10_9FUNG|nr:Mitochondrial carrier protein ymc2 [Mycoemilia scoparia]